jgi:hypothetical protein
MKYFLLVCFNSCEIFDENKYVHFYLYQHQNFDYSATRLLNWRFLSHIFRLEFYDHYCVFLEVNK